MKTETQLFQLLLDVEAIGLKLYNFGIDNPVSDNHICQNLPGCSQGVEL